VRIYPKGTIDLNHKLFKGLKLYQNLGIKITYKNEKPILVEKIKSVKKAKLETLENLKNMK